MINRKGCREPVPWTVISAGRRLSSTNRCLWGIEEPREEIVVHPDDLEDAWELLQPENYRRFHAYAAAIENRAVFEIPDILDRILATCEKPS